MKVRIRCGGVRAIAVAGVIGSTLIASGAFGASPDGGQSASPAIELAALDGEGGEELSPEAVRQAPLLAAHRALESVANQSGPGLGTIQVDWDANELRLYWKGQLPSALVAALDQVRERHVVHVHPAEYSWVELDAVIQSMIRQVQNQPILDPVVGIQMETDLSGLIIFLDSPDLAVQPLADRLLEVADVDVPLRFVHEEWAISVDPAEAGSRVDDQPPFVGGARMQYTSGFFSTTTHRCTTGFSVETYDKTLTGMASAKHCGKDQVWYTPAGKKIGKSDMYLTQEHDGMVITWPTGGLLSAKNPGFAGKIYVGTHASTQTGGIAGSASPVLGELQCVSGSFSGAWCSNRVDHVNYYDTDLGMGGPMHVTTQTSGLAAAGNGDSGGPNYSLGTNTRTAKGIISAIAINSNERPCRGEPTTKTRVCSHIVFHTTLQPFINAFGLRVKTAPYS